MEKLTFDVDQIIETLSNLIIISNELDEAYDKTVMAKNTFADQYEGEAKPEIDAFLESLPEHIQKLRLLYVKLTQFVVVTMESLKNSDEKMAENMK